MLSSRLGKSINSVNNVVHQSEFWVFMERTRIICCFHRRAPQPSPAPPTPFKGRHLMYFARSRESAALLFITSLSLCSISSPHFVYAVVYQHDQQQALGGLLSKTTIQTFIVYFKIFTRPILRSSVRSGSGLSPE